MLAHDFIDQGKVAEIGQKDIELNNIAQIAAGGLTDGTEIFKYLINLRADITIDQGHGLWIQRNLPRQIDGIVDLNGLHVGPYGSRGAICMNNGFIGHLILLG